MMQFKGKRQQFTCKECGGKAEKGLFHFLLYPENVFFLLKLRTIRKLPF
jgi:hypothetical protein